MATINRPSPHEHAPYYSRYIDLVPPGNILTSLSNPDAGIIGLLSGVSESKAQFRYAPGKWSIKEVVGHVIDSERVFGFRAFAFSRNDKNPLPGMEQDDYARGANYEERPFRDILDEFADVRNGNLRFFKSLDENMLMRVGKASGFDFTVRSLVYIIAGHELHHMTVLREKYLR
jgi:hypothetical protein